MRKCFCPSRDQIRNVITSLRKNIKWKWLLRVVRLFLPSVISVSIFVSYHASECKIEIIFS